MLRATENYALFAQAEMLHMSVRELLTGARGPLTQLEFYLWQRYRTAQARLQQQARKAPGKG